MAGMETGSGSRLLAKASPEAIAERIGSAAFAHVAVDDRGIASFPVKACASSIF